MMSTGLASRLATRAAELRQAQIRVMELEQELTDISHELARGDLGPQVTGYLQGKVIKLLYGRPRGEVTGRMLFSALEDAWRAGAFHARGGSPGPAPVQHQPGTPPWLHHLSIELEDALVRNRRTFTPEQEAQIRGTWEALRELAREKGGQ